MCLIDTAVRGTRADSLESACFREAQFASLNAPKRSVLLDEVHSSFSVLLASKYVSEMTLTTLLAA